MRSTRLIRNPAVFVFALALLLPAAAHASQTLFSNNDDYYYPHQLIYLNSTLFASDAFNGNMNLSMFNTSDNYSVSYIACPADNGLMKIAYSNSTGLIYGLSYNGIYAINVSNRSCSKLYSGYFSQGSFDLDDSFIYAANYSEPSSLFKINITSGSLVNSTLTGFSKSHAVVYNEGFVYVTTTEAAASVIKFNASSMAVVDSKTYGMNAFTDDFAVTQNYLYVGAESSAGMLRINKSNLSDYSLVYDFADLSAYSVESFNLSGTSLIFFGASTMIPSNSPLVVFNESNLSQRQYFIFPASPNEIAFSSSGFFVSQWQWSDYYYVPFGDILLQASIYPLPLGTPNQQFTLAENLSTNYSSGILVQAPNVTIDCNGHSITSDIALGSGIYSNYSGTVVKNCNIDGFYRGFFFNGVTGGAIDNSSSTNPIYSFYLASSSGNTLSNLTATSSSSQGIYLSSSPSNKFINVSNNRNYNGFSRKFYSNSVQNTLFSYLDTGWWPLLNSNGSSAIPQASTAFYNGSAGGKNNDGASNSSLHYWFNNQQNFTLRCAALMGNNSAYALDSNITAPAGSSCFDVQAENITIDCNGYSITGDNSTDTYGIYSNQSGTTIRNCQISNFQDGIRLDGATNGSITNTTAITTHASGSGLSLLNGANNNSISSSAFTSASSYPVSIASSSTGNTFLNNSITGAMWVNNSGSGNIFNSSSMGNRYYFANGSGAWAAFDMFDLDGDSWADGGDAVPISAATLGGYWSGNGADYHPYIQAGAYGNASNVTAPGIANLSVSINGNATINGRYFAGALPVIFSDGDAQFLNFTFNFSLSSLNFSSITIENGTSGGKAYFSISGIDPSAIIGGKNLTMHGASESYSQVCVMDLDSVFYTNISSTCTEANETLLTCDDGTVNNRKWCDQFGTTIRIYNLTHSAVMQFALPSPPFSTGGSSLLAPRLTYSFNCSSGLFAVTATTYGKPISGLSLHLKDPSKTGWLGAAATNPQGIAYFTINESKRYSAESMQTSGYSQAYLGAFALTLCPGAQEPELPAPQQSPAIANNTSLELPAPLATTVPQKSQKTTPVQSPAKPDETVGKITEKPAFSLEAQQKTADAAPSAASPQAFPSSVAQTGAVAVFAAAVGYLFFIRKKKRRGL